MPKIVEKDYYQIRSSATWPTSLKPVLRLTNRGLVVLQDSAHMAARQGVDDMKNWAFGHITSRVPGYKTYSSLRGKAERLWGGLSKAEVDLAKSNLDLIRQTITEVSSTRATGSLKRYEEQKTAAFEKTQREVIGLVKDTTEWGVKGEWQLGETSPGAQNPGVVAIEKKPKHADQFRIDRWFPPE
jgi:hypothetical protein